MKVECSSQKQGRDVPDVPGLAPKTVPGTLPRHADLPIPLPSDSK